MKHMYIKLNDVQAQWEEIEKDCVPEILDYLKKGEYINSSYINRFEESFAHYTDALYSIMTSSGTSAFRSCLYAIKSVYSDICVLLPNNTWASMLYVVKGMGFKYAFIDCDRSAQLDTHELENWLISHRKDHDTVVIVATHILGYPCNTPEINKISQAYNCLIVEDCSQAVGAKVNNTMVGDNTFSDLSFWSLYPGKNLGASSDAGIICTSKKDFYETIKSYINCGMSSKNKFFCEGENFRPCGVSSIVLYHKLQKLDTWNNARQTMAQCYETSLSKFKLNFDATPVYHYYPIVVEDRNRVLNLLDKAGIPYSINYPFTLAQLDNNYKKYIISDSLKENMICLPCHPHMTIKQIKYIIERVKDETN